jgi:hypothetical protein
LEKYIISFWIYNDTARGTDDIPDQLHKQLPEQALKTFLDLLNNI